MTAAWGQEGVSYKPVAEAMRNFLRIDKVLKVGKDFRLRLKAQKIKSHRW
jgi:hypothetical protein